MLDENSIKATEIGFEFADVDRYYFDVAQPTKLWWVLLTQAATERRRAKRNGETFAGKIVIRLVRPPSGGEEFLAMEPLDEADVANAREVLTPYFAKRGFTIGEITLKGVSWGTRGEVVDATVTFS